jgi:hypothetical protein
VQFIVRFTSGAQVNIGEHDKLTLLARSFLAVLFGFIVFIGIIRMLTALAGSLSPNPPAIEYLVLSLAWTVAAAVLAGFIAARIAGSHEFPHSAALGLLMVIMGVISMRQEGVTQPGWHQIAVAGCGPVSAMIGAALRVLTKTRQAAKTNTSGAASRR